MARFDEQRGLVIGRVVQGVQQMLLVLLKQGGWIWHPNYLQLIYDISISLSTSFAFVYY
jgi:hypothetical protein